jgi:acylphosphatase
LTHGAIDTRQVRVHGRVQGVGYRYTCVQQARALGLVGWVRNRADGTVEALLQGPPDVVARMCDWMRDGIAAARVERLDVEVVEPPTVPFEGFEQRPTK